MEYILLYLKDSHTFVHIAYGTGDNLNDEDIVEGLDAYLYIEVYSENYSGIENIDGGMLMYNTKETNYEHLESSILDVLEFLDYDKYVEYTILAHIE